MYLFHNPARTHPNKVPLQFYPVNPFFWTTSSSVLLFALIWYLKNTESGRNTMPIVKHKKKLKRRGREKRSVRKLKLRKKARQAKIYL